MKKIILLAGLIFSISLFNLRAQQIDVDTHKIMLIGTDGYGKENFRYLAGAKEEVSTISQMFPKENVLVLEKDYVTLSNLLMSKDFKPAILQISGHGFSYPLKRESDTEVTDYLLPVFSNDPIIISREEGIINREACFSINNFSQYFPEGIELVVMATPKSNQPVVIDNLKAAGVKACILTNNNLEDDLSLLFMQFLYRNLTSGLSLQESFDTAKQQLIENGYVDPEYHETFSLIEL